MHSLTSYCVSLGVCVPVSLICRLGTLGKMGLALLILTLAIVVRIVTVGLILPWEGVSFACGLKLLL